MAIVRPKSLEIIDVEIEFNFVSYRKIEIDLHHINRGKSLTRESTFSLFEIVNLVKIFLEGKILKPDNQRMYGDESCDYFTFIADLNGKKYKLVFCVCTDRRDTLGVITLYRLRS